MLICLQRLKPEVIVINTVIEMALSKKSKQMTLFKPISAQTHTCVYKYIYM